MRVGRIIAFAVLAAGCRQLAGIGDTDVAGAADAPPAPAIDAAAPPDAARPDAAPDAVPDATPAPDAAPLMREFRQGANGYSGVIDTDIDESNPGSDNSNSDDIDWDINGDDTLVYGLIQYTDLFGPGPTRIPPGAAILQATLWIYITSEAHPPAGTVNEIAVAWDDNLDYASFGPQPGVQAGDLGPVVGPTPIGTGPAIIDVTASLAAWSANPAANHGWILIPADSGDAAAASSDEPLASRRPTLTVVYYPP